ncbi:MAG: Uma2 family endonuclease [Armatimonadetes bacterium]|nr:Uma2 family endonuclease [Armatimonadota bacterium]
MATTTTLLTAEDLQRLPENGKQFELVRGELIEVSPPGIEHGTRAVRIANLIDEYAEAHGLGTVAVESGFRLSRDPDTVRGPDVSFISRERLDPDVAIEGFAEFAPDLAVEIVSPGDTYAEVAEKVDEYLRAGTRLVWVVDLKAERVTVFPGGQMLTGDEELTGGEVLPGFAVPVSRIFGRRTRQK